MTPPNSLVHGNRMDLIWVASNIFLTISENNNNNNNNNIINDFYVGGMPGLNLIWIMLEI